jgi:dynein heavy chain
VTSDVAREEFKIENALDKIQNKWDNFNLELDPYKKGFKLKKAEAISEVLEDHMGILSA